MKRVYKRRKKSNSLLLIILVLAVSVGYALISGSINITGLAGIKKNTWDIHWNEDSIVETENSVTATTPAHVTDNEKKNVSFDVDLALPGDFYEFTLDAKNYGTVAGEVKTVTLKFYDPVTDEEVDPSDVPDYLIYTFTHADGTPIPENEKIVSNASIKYKFRVEFDPEETSLPDFDPEEDKKPTPKPKIKIETEQAKNSYTITFNPNGGDVGTTTKEVKKGESIGNMPTPEWGYPYEGWYTEIDNGIEVKKDFIPQGDMTVYAHWISTYTTFDTGKNVNGRMKKLANPSITNGFPYEEADIKINHIVRTNQQPDISNMDEGNILSVSDADFPIYAWYDSETATIYWWTKAKRVYLNEDASYMFYNLNAINETDTSFNTKKTTNMAYMFSNSTFNELDVSGFDTSNVTTMDHMFNGNGRLTELDISNFDTSNVGYMNYMFSGCVNLTSLDFSNFDTSKVYGFSNMFAGSSKLTSLDLHYFDISKATSISSIFDGCSSLQSINISGWNFYDVSSIEGLFSGLLNLETIELENVNTSRVSTFKYLFSGCSKLKSLDLSSFNISNAYNIDSVFSGCTSLEYLNIDGWNFKNFSSITGYFSGLTSLKTISLRGVNTSSISNMSGLFSGDSKLENIDVSSINTSNVSNMSSMFYGCSSIKKLDLSSFDTKNVSNMSSLVGGMTSLEELNLSNFNFRYYNPGSLMMPISSGGFAKLKTLKMNNVIFPSNMSYGFGGLSTVERITFKNANTTSVTDMTNMFNGDSSLVTLDLGSFNTSSVTKMGYMFYNCTSLTTISVSDDFVVSQVTESGNMFTNDNVLVGGAGTPYSDEHIDKEYAHYDYGETNPGYFNKSTVNKYEITFDPNGGTVDETTREVIEDQKIGTLPTPTREGYGFDGWYTGLTDGIKIDSDLIVTQAATYHAHWLPNSTITYNANTGVFDNDTTTNVINYEYANTSVVKYSHTPNINDDGSASNTYDSNYSMTDVVTIPGSDSLTIEIWFSTESASYDWVAIYPKGVTPSDGNDAAATISGGKLAGHGSYYGSTKPADSDTTYHRTFTVSGDTAQFYFRSDSSSNYYGYYAIITGSKKGYTKDNDYKEPTKNENDFLGWTISQDGSGKVYKNENEIIEDISTLGSSQTLYAKWKQLNKYTITFNPNGGTVEETTRQVLENEKIGSLPVPTKGNAEFQGWYRLDEILVDGNYIPNANETLYAHWNECGDFATASWDTINRKVQEDPKTYPVGCRKEVDLGTYGKHVVRVANNTTPVECSRNDNSQTACGFVLEFEDIITTHRMNPLNTSSTARGNGAIGGWEYSEMRTFVNNDIYNALPQDLQNVIIPTYVISGYSGEDITNSSPGKASNLFKTVDKLYLLSYTEVLGVDQEMIDTYYEHFDEIQNQGKYITDYYAKATDGIYHYDIHAAIKSNQLDYYKYHGSYTRTYRNPLDPNSGAYDLNEIKKYNGEEYNWWSRTPYRKHDFYFLDFGKEDKIGANNETWASDSELGVSPAFKIGTGTKVKLNANGGTVNPSSIITGKNTPIGTLPTPTRPGYKFIGWYQDLLEGLEITSDYIVTAPTTLYAKWQKNNIITFDPNGGSVTESTYEREKGEEIGNLPEATYEDKMFQGWYTAKTGGRLIHSMDVPTGDMTVYARWNVCRDFATASWATIEANVNQDPEHYAVGCTKEVNMGTYGTHTVRVANNTTPAECNSTGFSHSACGFVVEFTDIILESPAVDDSADRNIEGQLGASDMYIRYMRPDSSEMLFKYLPQDLKEIISDTRLLLSGSNNYQADRGTGFILNNEKLYLLSDKEIYGNKYTNGYENATRQLDYYAIHDVVVNKTNTSVVYNTEAAIKNYNGTPSAWWERNINFDASGYRLVSSNGQWGAASFIYSHGISPTFRIGNNYKVTFNANGGTVSEAYRRISSSQAVGDLPEAVSNDYLFEGWYTDPINGIKIDRNYIPEGDTTLYARYSTRPKPTFFEAASWQEIITAYNNGDLDDLEEAMKKGVKREVQIDMDGNGTAETYHVRIANLSSPSSCSQSTFSQTACGFVLEFTDILGKNRWNPYEYDRRYYAGNGTNGGWKNSEIRTYVNSTIYNKLPSDLKNNIINTRVISNHRFNQSYNKSDKVAYHETTDKLYLLAPKEIWNENVKYEETSSKTRQLDYYSYRNINLDEGYGEVIKRYNGEIYYWWLRNAQTDNQPFYVTKNGYYGGWAYIEDASKARGVSPSFRLG